MAADSDLLLLDRNAVDALLAPDDVVAAVREAFELHSRREGRVFPVIRESLATGGVFGIKAGDVPAQSLLGFKAAGFWPANRQLGGEPHQATILLFDPATGRPRCVIDGNTITTVRTGAAGALGLRTLARADSAVLTVSAPACRRASSWISRCACCRACAASSTLRRAAGRTDAAFETGFDARCDIRVASDADAAVAEADRHHGNAGTRPAVRA